MAVLMRAEPVLRDVYIHQFIYQALFNNDQP